MFLWVLVLLKADSEQVSVELSLAFYFSLKRGLCWLIALAMLLIFKTGSAQVSVELSFSFYLNSVASTDKGPPVAAAL
jgi:hypothetical protein